MSKRLMLKEGDIFEVRLHNSKKGYFQFIGYDITMLNSDVIRVFKGRYDSKEHISFDQIVASGVQFYAHVVIKLGVRMNLWKKVGNIPLEKNLEKPSFRSSLDYGNPKVKISKNWRVWKMNEDFRNVGPLTSQYQNYDIGAVMPPVEIVTKMEKGEYAYFYPKY